MEIFFTLIIKIIPLYVIILLGFLAGKYLSAQSKTVSSICIYTITPVVILHGLTTAKMTADMVLLPIIFFAVSSIIALTFYHIGKKIWKDTTKNIFGYTAGSGNFGYFGLPVALLIFGDGTLGYIVSIIFGVVLYESTVGFFLAARGHHTIKESIFKVLKLPSFYAFFLGVILNKMGIGLGEIFEQTATKFIGAYSVLGMMIIGMALTGIKRHEIDFKFISLSFLTKFLIWPAIIFGIIYLDKNFTGFFENETIYNIMILMSTVPLGANTVSFATELKTEPGKAAVAVLLSTIFALFFIPLIVSNFLQ